MNTYKLLVALSLIANPDANPVVDTAPDVFAFASWDGAFSSDLGGEALFVSPFLYLRDLAAAKLGRFEPANPHARVHAALAAELRSAAIKLELMDLLETAILLHDSNSFAQDLKTLQRRFQDLADAPAVGEAGRFPDHESITELLAVNRGYREELCQRLLIDRVHSRLIQTAIAETDHLYQVWNTLRDARCGFYYVAVRRHALRQLRDLIGAPAFYRGELPPHLPTWRLPQVR
jgi:hypothetical protein